jgi:hypothetical protein
VFGGCAARVAAGVGRAMELELWPRRANEERIVSPGGAGVMDNFERENAIMTTGGDDGSFADDVREAEIPLIAVGGDDGIEDRGESYLEVVESAKRVAGAGAGRVLP